MQHCFLSSIAVLLTIGCDHPLGVFPQEPGGRPAAAPVNRARFDDRDYQAHIDELKQRLPSDQEFFIVVAQPFVVVGHGSEEQVRSWADGTVAWAVERLKARYFTEDPSEIIDVWLFNDKSSYERYNRELFDSAPTTPFGYYSAEHHALVMNIATGGGTLVHEIVHPFIAANFKNCPSWFNEGFPQTNDSHHRATSFCSRFPAFVRVSRQYPVGKLATR